MKMLRPGSDSEKTEARHGLNAMSGLFAFLAQLFHRHNYDMCFENPDDPLAWTFRCRCGATTHDINQAL